DMVGYLKSGVQDIGSHLEFRCLEWTEPHRIADLDQRLRPDPAIAKYAGVVFFDEIAVLDEDGIFLDELRPVFVDGIKRVIDDVSIPILETAAEFLEQALVPARIHAVEKKLARLLSIL